MGLIGCVINSKGERKGESKGVTKIEDKGGLSGFPMGTQAHGQVYLNSSMAAHFSSHWPSTSVGVVLHQAQNDTRRDVPSGLAERGKTQAECRNVRTRRAGETEVLQLASYVKRYQSGADKEDLRKKSSALNPTNHFRALLRAWSGALAAHRRTNVLRHTHTADCSSS